MWFYQALRVLYQAHNTWQISNKERDWLDKWHAQAKREMRGNVKETEYLEDLGID